MGVGRPLTYLTGAGGYRPQTGARVTDFVTARCLDTNFPDFEIQDFLFGFLSRCLECNIFYTHFAYGWLLDVAFFLGSRFVCVISTFHVVLQRDV